MSRKISSYIYVTSHGSEWLSELVAEKTKDGYVCDGDVIITIFESKTQKIAKSKFFVTEKLFFCQRMLKYKE